MTTSSSLTTVARQFIHSYWGATLLLAISWQLVMTLIGVTADFTFGESQHTLLEHTAHWDGGWYLSILNGSYADPASPSPVFYPLFPLVAFLAQVITFHSIDILALGLVINTVSLWFALVAILKIADFFVSPRHAWWAVVLFLTSPAAIFTHMFYSEAIFCAIAFWAYLFALRRRWAVMAILLAVASSARLPAILIIGLCALEFMRAYKWRIKEILNPNLLWFLLVPLGFIAYGLFLQLVRGDFLAMFHSYDLTKDWSYHVFNPNILHTILKEVYVIFLTMTGARPFGPSVIVSAILPTLALTILLITSLYAILKVKGRGVPLGAFGLVSLVFFTINNNTVSVHRYMLPCLGIYLMTTVMLEKYNHLRPVLYGVTYVGILVQAYLIFLFVGGWFAG